MYQMPAAPSDPGGKVVSPRGPLLGAEIFLPTPFTWLFVTNDTLLELLLQTQRQLFSEWLARHVWVPRPLGRTIGRWTLLLRQWRDAASTEAAFQV